MTDIAGERRDRFTPSYGLWTTVLLVFLSASEELDMALNLWILIIPVMLLPTAIILFWFLIALGIHLVRRRWRRVASVVLGPAIALACMVTIFRAGFDVTWVRFEATKNRYIRQLQSATMSPRFSVWRWGEIGGVMSANSFYTLVFDESDNIAKNPQERTAGNKHNPSVLSGAVAESESESGPWLSVRHLEGHFYLVCEVYE